MQYTEDKCKVSVFRYLFKIPEKPNNRVNLNLDCEFYPKWANPIFERIDLIRFDDIPK